MWGSAAEFHLKLLERQVYSVARLRLDQSFLSLCHRRRVLGLSMLYKFNSNSNHCLLSELPFASTRVRHTRAAAVAHPLEFEVSRFRTSQFARSFLPAQVRMWNDLYTVFDTGTLDGSKGAVNNWLLPRVVFSSVSRGCRLLWVCQSNLYTTSFFPTWACAAGFNNNNNVSFEVCD